jgi:hypothetical protein
MASYCIENRGYSVRAGRTGALADVLEQDIDRT